MSQPHPPLEPEQMYHIWPHVNGGENFFRVGENYRYFLKRYAYYIHPVVENYAYCLMPNHLHLMVRIKNGEDVLAVLRERRPAVQGLEALGKPLEGFPKPSACCFPICSMLTLRHTTKYLKERAACLSQTLRES